MGKQQQSRGSQIYELKIIARAAEQRYDAKLREADQLRGWAQQLQLLLAAAVEELSGGTGSFLLTTEILDELNPEATVEVLQDVGGIELIAHNTAIEELEDDDG